jgi:hypothetical protein
MVKLARPTAVNASENRQEEGAVARGVKLDAGPSAATAAVSSAPAPLAEGAGGAAWRIGRRGAACAACARVFEEGSLVFSAIFAEETAGSDAVAIRRVDRCGVCHQRRERQAQEVHWRTQFHSEPRKPRLDIVALGEVFRQLAARQDPRFADFLYLVTLMMLRHRKLRVVKTRSDAARDYLSVAFPRTKNTLDIEVVDLNPERMEFLRGQLLALFEGGGLTSLTAELAPGSADAAAAPAAAEVG